MSTEPHAVRWANRKVRHEMEWTRWHYTDDASFTACGLPIAISVASFLPDTDDDLETVDCKHCLRKMSAR